MKVIAGGIAALVAGIGGGLLALAQTTFQPSEFATFAGVVWLAILVTIGVRSNAAALIAGLAFVFPSALLQYYFSTVTILPNLLPVLFGLGAISAAKYPDGALAENSRKLRSLSCASRPSTVERRCSGIDDLSSGSASVDPDRRSPSRSRDDDCDAGGRRGRPAPGPPGAGRRGDHRPLRRAHGSEQRLHRRRPRRIAGLVGPERRRQVDPARVLSGLLGPTRAGVAAGQGRHGASPRARAGRGLARTFQQPELFLGLTVREHLVVAHRARVSPNRLWRDMFDPRSLLPPSKAENERIDGLLELLRLTRVAKAPVAALPLGILRLVEVGRALASDPQVLLLDEPLSGLDIKASENLLGVFRHIVDQADPPLSLILVEHDVAAVLSLSDLVFVLDFGERIAVGTPEQIRNDPAVRAAYLGDSEPPQRRPSAPAVAPDRRVARRR